MRGFFSGMAMGAGGALAAGLAILYALSMTQVVAVSVIAVPDVGRFLGWIYDNLRLSVIPFSLTLALYLWSMARLRRLLATTDPPPERVAQSETLLDVWINLFFGIGVIWTAVGMRGALLAGLGGLDAEAAARAGAFNILKRLVDGGILLALSTTIFGGVGGYLMRVGKAVTVGRDLQGYYVRLDGRRSDEIFGALKNMEGFLAKLAEKSPRPPFRKGGEEERDDSGPAPEAPVQKAGNEEETA